MWYKFHFQDWLNCSLETRVILSHKSGTKPRLVTSGAKSSTQNVSDSRQLKFCLAYQNDNFPTSPHGHIPVFLIIRTPNLLFLTQTAHHSRDAPTNPSMCPINPRYTQPLPRCIPSLHDVPHHSLDVYYHSTIYPTTPSTDGIAPSMSSLSLRIAEYDNARLGCCRLNPGSLDTQLLAHEC